MPGAFLSAAEGAIEQVLYCLLVDASLPE